MFNLNENEIILIYIFLFTSFNGLLYGIVSNIIARRKLKDFKENFTNFETLVPAPNGTIDISARIIFTTTIFNLNNLFNN